MLIAEWDQMPSESSRWYERFTRFRLLGPHRTVAAAWREETGEAGRSAPSRWYSTAEEWNWQARAQAWDASERPQRESQRQAELEEMHSRQLEYHLLQQELAISALREVDPLTLTVDQILKMLQAGIDGERRCREEPEAIELRRMVEELRERLEGGG